MLSDDDVVRLLTIADAVELLEQRLRMQCRHEAESTPRSRTRVGDFVMHVLPAAAAGPALGAKLYLSGGARTQFIYLLFGPSGLEAMIAADHLGRLRTGAASALATRYLASPTARRLVLFGSGNQARYQAEGVCTVRPIDRLTLCARNIGRAEALAADLRQALDIEITVASNAHNAIAEADVICTMTSAPEPLFDGNALPARIHINAAGSNRATHREIDDATLTRATSIFVDDIEQARGEAGDFLRAANFDWTRVRPLGDIFNYADAPPTGISLFESLGIGLWDLALATELFARAQAGGIGRRIDLPEFFGSSR